jgi:hypothetical protein
VKTPNLFRWRLKLLVAAAAASVALATAAAAFAGNVTATATVNGAGSLGLSHASSVTLPTTTLDGTDKTATYSVALNVDDARGSGAGWNLSITSTTFNDGTGQTLSTGASSLSAVSSSCRAGGSCTNPTNSVSYPLSVPAGASAPAAVKFFNAAASSGLGRFTITPSIDVSIPGNAYAGTYTSTVTFAVASGP